MHNGTIYQGIIATKPRNPIFLPLIEHIVNVPKPVKRYFEFTSEYRMIAIRRKVFFCQLFLTAFLFFGLAETTPIHISHINSVGFSKTNSVKVTQEYGF